MKKKKTGKKTVAQKRKKALSKSIKRTAASRKKAAKKATTSKKSTRGKASATKPPTKQSIGDKQRARRKAEIKSGKRDSMGYQVGIM